MNKGKANRLDLNPKDEESWTFKLALEEQNVGRSSRDSFRERDARNRRAELA